MLPWKRNQLRLYSMTANYHTDVACKVSDVPHLMQHVRINISAADDGHVHDGFWQLVFVE
jgi:hypothetical protein